MEKVIILGATGFVGRNLFEVLADDNQFDTLGTSRQNTPLSKNVYFDLLDKNTWQHIVDAQPTILVNAIGYGVVKGETDLATMYDVNYLVLIDFIHFISKHLPSVFWVQIGTAFEYDLSIEKISETSICVPKTHYGISKLLFSNFLNQKSPIPFVLIRPFAMFGKYEHPSKIIPYLMSAQIKKQEVALSSGQQKRDYIFVVDVCVFIKNLLRQKENFGGVTINIGSGLALSLQEIAERILECDDHLDPDIWKWGALAQRTGESDVFFNDSKKAFDLNLVVTPLNLALKITYMFYKSIL
jgi:nucleoside-diphosphate-sugar epimerase